MSLLSRGLSILDESPEEPNGKPEEEIAASETKTEETKTVETAKVEEAPKPEKVSSEPAPPDAKTEENSNYVSDEEFQRASKELRKSNKGLKRDNEGLSIQLETTKEIAGKVPGLEAEVEKLQRKTDDLELAGKYGVSPSLLEPINLNKEGKEQWLRDHLDPATSDSKPVESPSKKIEEPESKKDDDPVEDAPVEEKPKPGIIPDVDKDRPEAKTVEDKSPTEGMTQQQKLEHWKNEM